ncbi:MAG: hypothetical protein JXR76_08920 [Deltaproteobacteria bacterium]|nr:hypothetical protein [Deltaproteobacteria bacterium]
MAKSLFRIFFIFLSIAMVSSSVMAQDEAPTPELLPEISDNIVDYQRPGWHPRLKFNGNFQLGQSKDVPGNTDGVTLQVGSLLHATADYLSPDQNHEWTNMLHWDLGYSRTPVVDEWIKSMDRLEFETAYLYHFSAVRWMGPMYRLRMGTSLLPAYEVRSFATAVVKLDDNDVPHGLRNYAEGTRIPLTDAFAPLTLRQMLGLFARPVSKTAFRLDSNLGLGMWKTWTRGGYVLDDIEDTDALELRRIDNPFQMGAEAEVKISGELKENLVSYAAGGMLMYPFYSDKDDTTDLSGAEKMNRELFVTLGVNVTEYLSINYTFKAMKYPLIIDKVQIQNSLLLSVGFDLIGNPPPVPPDAPCDCADAINAAKTDWEAAKANAKKQEMADEFNSVAESETVLPQSEAVEAPVAGESAAPGADVASDNAVDSAADGEMTEK